LRHAVVQAAACPAQAVTLPGLKSLLQSVRELCRRINGYIARQGRDRIRGRFWGQEIEDAVRMCEGDADHLSAGDYVAVSVKGERIY
jgi:hypothetical protein